MTVAELIEKLQKCQPDSLVMISNWEEAMYVATSKNPLGDKYPPWVFVCSDDPVEDLESNRDGDPTFTPVG